MTDIEGEAPAEAAEAEAPAAADDAPAEAPAPAEEDAEEPVRGMVSTIGELPAIGSRSGVLSEENLAALDQTSFRKRTLSNSSMHSVDRAMKTLGHEAGDAAVTSAAVNDTNLQPKGRTGDRRGSAIKAMEKQGNAFAEEQPAASTTAKSKSSACVLL